MRPELSDLLVAPCWLLVNLVLILVAVKLARAAFPGDSALQMVGHCVVFVWAVVAAAAFALSLFHQLSGRNLLLGALTLAVAAYHAARTLAPRSNPRPHGQRPGGAPPVGGRVLPPASRLWPLAWCALAFYWVTLAVYFGLLKFTIDFDTIMYHVPLVDYWLKARGLYAPESFHWSNPGNSEVLALWMTGAFSGDFLSALGNLPAALLLASGTYSVAREFGLPRSVCHAAALMVCANSVVLRQLTDAGNDLSVAGLFLACLGYGLRYARSRRPLGLLYASVCLGLLAGVKFYALGYAATAWAGVSLLLIRDRGWRRSARPIAAGVALSLPWGAYWYLRNFWVTGSPFYPLDLTRSSDALSQSYPEAWRTSFLANLRPDVLVLWLQAIWKICGPGHVLAFILLPLALAWMLASVVRRARRGPLGHTGAARAALIFLTVGSGLVLLITPLALEDRPGTLNHLKWGYTPVRYGLSFLSLTVLCLAVSLHDLAASAGRWVTRPRPEGRRPAGALRSRRALPVAAVCTLLASIAAYQTLLPEEQNVWRAVESALAFIDVNVVFWSLFAFWVYLKRRTAAPVASLAAVLALTSVPLAGVLSHRWHQQFSRYYATAYSTQVFGFLRGLGGGRVCLLDHRCHPFFGPDRATDLCQPIDSFRNEDFLNYLGLWRARYVVLRTEPDTEPAGWDKYEMIRPWVAGNPAVFKSVYTDPAFTVFKVSSPHLRAVLASGGGPRRGRR